MKHEEYNLQKQICNYLDLQYSDVDYISDTIASLKLTKSQAIRNKAIQKKDFKCPDLLILHPSGGYYGLFIELKIESPFKKNGRLKSNEHLQGQNKSMNKLLNKGYYCTFSWSFDQAKYTIDNYMKSN